MQLNLEMDSPFFRNRRWYQQPDSTRNPFSHSPSFNAAPVYHIDPTVETSRSVQRPTEGNAGPKVVRIPVHFVGSEQVDRTVSAVKIQKIFRGFLARKCLKKIKDIKIQVDEIEARLSKREVVDLVRRDERVRLRMSESLMSLLFKLDSICGFDYGIRGCRKAVIRKAVAMQERIDAIVAVDLEENGENTDRMSEITVSVEPSNLNESVQVVNLTDSIGNSGASVGCQERREGGDDKSMEVEGNDGEAEIIDVGVDCEVKVSGLNGARAAGALEDVDIIAEENEGEAKKGNGVVDNRTNRELLERMMEDNEKMISMMSQLFESNEMQTRMLHALTDRVELLEKAFLCDRLRKKKKTKVPAPCKEN